MPSKSKSQQRFWGMVYDCRENGNCPDQKIKDVAKSVKKKVITEFAETKHKNLPEKVKKRKSKKKKKRKNKKSYAILSELIKVANYLDRHGNIEEADYLDQIITLYAKSAHLNLQ